MKIYLIKLQEDFKHIFQENVQQILYLFKSILIQEEYLREGHYKAFGDVF